MTGVLPGLFDSNAAVARGAMSCTQTASKLKNAVRPPRYRIQSSDVMPAPATRMRAYEIEPRCIYTHAMTWVNSKIETARSRLMLSASLCFLSHAKRRQVIKNQCIDEVLGGVISAMPPTLNVTFTLPALAKVKVPSTVSPCFSGSLRSSNMM